MRALFALLLVATVGFAGCSSDDHYDCPAAYGPAYETAYNQAVQEYQNKTGESPPDADRDCVPDVVEAQYGTNPKDASSYPSPQQLGFEPTNGTVPGSPGGQVPMTYQWETNHYQGSFTSTTLAAPAQTDPGTVDVPEMADRVLFNLTVTGSVPGENNVRLNPPSCTSTSGCPNSLTGTTANGAISFDVASPESGSWHLLIFAGTGVQTGSFAMDVAAHVMTMGNMPQTVTAPPPTTAPTTSPPA